MSHVGELVVGPTLMSGDLDVSKSREGDVEAYPHMSTALAAEDGGNAAQIVVQAEPYLDARFIHSR